MDTSLTYVVGGEAMSSQVEFSAVCIKKLFEVPANQRKKIIH
jgi:hypothetical protein